MTKLLKNLHQLLFYLLILFLPTQLTKHFWPDWTLVQGIRIDYLSPTVYLTDLIILGVLVSWIGNTTLKLKVKSEKLKVTVKSLKLIFFLFSFFIFNIIFSQNRLVAFLKVLKIAELIMLTIYVKNNSSITQLLNYSMILSITVIYSSLIAWTQFFKQASIGGLFWWLGERTFSSSTLGIAQVVSNGRLFLRPYATFSHPNVLGGYIATVLPLLIFNSQFLIFNQFSIHNFQLKPINILRILAVVLGMLTLFITFSRAAWIVGGLGIATSFFGSFFEVKRGSRRLRGPREGKLLVIGYRLLVIIFIFLSCIFLGKERLLGLKADAESIKLRQELNHTALLMIKKYPLTGVGLNNFIPSLPLFKKGLEYKELQPAHNIYLLIGAESGLVGLGVFLWVTFKAYQKLISNFKLPRKSGVSVEKLIPNQIPNPDFRPHDLRGRKLATQSRQSQSPKKFLIRLLVIGNYLGQLVIGSIRNFVPIASSPLFISLTSILLLGLADHYFYTLQQTQLLFAIVMGMIFGVK